MESTKRGEDMSNLGGLGYTAPQSKVRRTMAQDSSSVQRRLQLSQGGEATTKLNNHPSTETTPPDPSRKDAGPTRFLQFHLKVLMSLDGGEKICCDEEATNNAEAESKQEIWDLIKEFMQRRQELCHAKEKAERCSAVFNQASEYAQQRHPPVDEKGEKTHPVRPLMAAPATQTTPFKYQESPGSISCTSPHHGGDILTMTSPRKRANAGNDSTLSSLNSFAIVAHLLGKQSSTMDKTFRKQSNPFRRLSKISRHRVAQLKQSLQEQQDGLQNKNEEMISELLSQDAYRSLHRSQNDEISPSRIQRKWERSEEEQSKLADTEAKIRLWSLLLSDVEAIV